MERPCILPGCHTTLSNHVPVHIRLCGMCQFKIIKLGDSLKIKDLPVADYIFLLCHPDGCSAKDLAKYLQVDEETISSNLIKGKINGQRQPNCKMHHQTWLILVPEIARVFEWIRNWITIHQVTEIAGVSRTTLHKYAREGRLGEIRNSFLFGRPAIHRRELPKLKAKCRKIKTKNEEKRLKPKNYLPEGACNPRQLAQLIDAKNNVIYRWLASERLPSTRDKNKWIISSDNIRSFVEKASSKEFRVNVKFIDKLKKLSS